MNVPKNQSPIQDYFKDKTVALTGATGFVGQCLIEKLMRSCPGIKKIILLVRPKKGVDPMERIIKLTQDEIFNKLREEQPNFIEKIQTVNCNLEQEQFGLSEESLQLLSDEVNIFFHSAATLRFNEHLRLAFNLNSLAVRRLIKICKQIKHLESLIHISTAYSHCDKREIGEELYEIHPKLSNIENAVNWMSDDMITKLTPDIIGERPNSYTFTKAIGEEILFTESDDLPVVILRPSIVGPSWSDPFPGWITNMNGPTGIMIAYGKGILQTMQVGHSLVLDVIPVDFTVSCVIAAAWKRGARFLEEKQLGKTMPKEISQGSINSSLQFKHRIRKDILIYNLTTGAYNPNVITEWHKSMLYWFESYPFNGAFRKPVFTLTTSEYTQRFLMFFYHYVPGFFFDCGLRILGRKPRITKFMKKVDSALEVLKFFLNHTFKWKNDNTMALLSSMSSTDRKTFNFDPRTINWHQYMKHFAMGCRKYILKDDPESYPAARRHIKRLRILSYCFHCMTFLMLWRLLVARTGIAQNVWRLVVSLCFKFLRFFQISSTLHRGGFFAQSVHA